MPSVFDQLVSEHPGNVTVADLAGFPERSRYSDARVLYPETVIVADCEPEDFRAMIREWDDRGTTEGLAEAVHQLDLDRAVQPPVIEVTVTTPPEGIPRLELGRIVAHKVAEITGPLPALISDKGGQPRRRRLLFATRPRLPARPRFVSRNVQLVPAPPAVSEDPVTVPVTIAVSEDDTPTQEFPAIPPEGWAHVEEVQVP